MTEHVKFMNEYIRTFADDVRAFEVRLNDLASRYNQLQGQIPSSDAAIDDGRGNEGLSQLSGNEVRSLVAKAQELLAVMAAEYWMDLVHKAGVRPMRA